MKYKVGQRIRALKTITEGGCDCPGDVRAKFPSPNYIHAQPGDLGCIMYVTEDGIPDAQFCRTHTGTIVTDDEIEVLNN